MAEPRPNFQLLPDLDGAILAELPKEGAKLGFHTLGKQVNQIVKDLNKKGGGLTGPAVSGRMSVLRHYKYAVEVTVQPVSKGFGYQITPKGEKWLASVQPGEE